MAQSQIQISIPESQKDKDVFFKIHNPVEKPVVIQKCRSFKILHSSGSLSMTGGKHVGMTKIIKMLQRHGLSDKIPLVISSATEEIQSIDWEPTQGVPTSWSFNWNGVECSISGKTDRYFCIKIYDLTSGVAEKVISELIEEIKSLWEPTTPLQSLSIYTTKRSLTGHSWCQNCTKRQRSMDTVYIEKDLKIKLIKGLENFYASHALYDKYGVTWKRVHMFYGPPGSGKTTTVLALASFFNKNIAKFTITPDLNSQDVESLFQSVPANSFVLLEDADALFVNREAKTSIDFSTLLNCMDGLTTQRGLTLFMTTNHLEKFDDAFMRPGRIDFKAEFKLPGRDEQLEALKVLASDYEHEHAEFLSKSEGMTIAQLQSHLFECIISKKVSIL